MLDHKLWIIDLLRGLG